MSDRPADPTRTVTVFDRKAGWLPRVVREDGRLRLDFAGGSDALHDPRSFGIPITEAHLEALRNDLPRHVILWSVLRPLCDAAGIRGPLDESAAVALLDPLLLSRPDDADRHLQDTKIDRLTLVAHGADIELLEKGRVVDALHSATAGSDWKRAQEYDAQRRRAQAGVVLTQLETAILRYTGQYVHRATVPHRDPSAIDPDLLPQVLTVIGTAEAASAGMTIARDPRRGSRGTDKQDWTRMEEAVETAVREAHPGLGEDAVGTVAFLMCAEAADRARTQPYDPEAGVDGNRSRFGALIFTDDKDSEQTWRTADGFSAVEAFWEFVAQRYGTGNQVFTLEDEARSEGIQLYFYADALARIAREANGTSSYRVEYGLLDDLAHCRKMVRGFVSGGIAALEGLTHWMSDPSELEAARRRRDDRRH
ncbi:hypothetical protein DFO66_103140 [Brevibacterium sanguinis]|uniref:CchlT n=2 Tax=Brevibacterium TaxID=1696 RepID=A0A366IKV0_9MICO|nr:MULTISPECIES: DUF6357 family protein [Brevibacterium]RBP66197.1 hypothetical protein DFO66_103140 [Brevibacterium sanguinis]RBP72848.1 hypothetical protein DFO65_103139 [Brevibacterium celere]